MSQDRIAERERQARGGGILFSLGAALLQRGGSGEEEAARTRLALHFGAPCLFWHIHFRIPDVSAVFRLLPEDVCRVVEWVVENFSQDE